MSQSLYGHSVLTNGEILKAKRLHCGQRFNIIPQLFKEKVKFRLDFLNDRIGSCCGSDEILGNLNIITSGIFNKL